MKEKIDKSSRRRSRPVNKSNIKKKIKRNKTAMFLAIFIVLMLVLGSLYVIFSTLGDDESESSYKNDPDYKSALAGSNYPVAVLETSKGVIAVELYDDKAPETCKNFINLVKDGFYDGMIFHRITDDFMIQAGSDFPDGTTKTGGNINVFEGTLSHANGMISMASTGPGVPGSAQFFICDGAQTFLDGSYAAFGKTIYGIEVVQDIADEPHDSSFEPNPGGGKPNTDIIIQKIYMAKE